MDNGEVITALNEKWTFAGCTMLEWGAGFMVFMLGSELVDKPGTAMPILLVALVATSLGLAGARKSQPDEEVGLRNLVMVSLGLCPPNLPKPCKLQPFWSGAPMKKLAGKSQFDQLGLGVVLNMRKPEGEEQSSFMTLDHEEQDPGLDSDPELQDLLEGMSVNG